MDRAYEFELLPSISTHRESAHTRDLTLSAYDREPTDIYDERMDIVAEREVSTRLTRRSPVRYVDFDTFDDPEQTASEVKKVFCDLAVLFCSAVTAIVAILLLM